MKLSEKMKKFMKDNDISKLQFINKWNGYNCYSEDFGDDYLDIGMPELILENNFEVRYATEEEMSLISDSIKY